MSLSSYFSRASDTPPAAETAMELGAAARRLYDDYKNAEIDAFALRLAAEKASKGAPSTVASPANIKVAGKGGGNRGGRASMMPRNKADARLKPMSSNIPRSLPSAGSIYRFDCMVPSVITTSTSVITENGYSYTLNSHPQGSTLAALFDQWCIPEFTIQFLSRYPSGATSAPGRFVTALDFDNTTALGSFAAYGQYSNRREGVMHATYKQTRTVAPCCKPSVNGSSNSAVQRIWLDCATPGTPWYSIRSCADITPAIQLIDVESYITFLFRNVI